MGKSIGALSSIGKTEAHQKEISLKKRVDNFINDIASDLGHPINEWDVYSWKKFSRSILGALLEEIDKHDDTKFVLQYQLKEVMRRQMDDKKRIESRPDQIDKRDFQKAVMENINGYKNKADAIRDQRANSQFADYPDETLRNWLKDIWNKPTKRGRPRKDSK